MSSKLPQLKRRAFLKQVSGLSTAGVALATGTLSSKVLAKNCSFSAFDPEFVYLNSGTEGSMPSCVLDSLSKNQALWAKQPTHSYETDINLGKHQHVNREKVAQFLNVKKNNICLTDNTTMGCSMVLMGLNFGPNDKAIMTNQEHNAIASPLSVQHSKVGLKVIKRNFPHAEKLSGMSSKEVLDYLFPNTDELRGAKALCVSHVYPSTGIQLPLNLLREKADELGIQYLVVDGAQAFGMLDLSQGSNAISHTDFYACPGHKWLNGPPSTGILYIRNENIQPPELYPVLSQRMYQYESGDSQFPMAEALQVRGCSNAPGFAAMLTAIEFEEQLGGSQAVEQHILGLSKRVKSFVTKHSKNALVSPYPAKELHSGLSVFFPFSLNKEGEIFTDKESAETVVNALLKKDIRIRYIGFDNGEGEKVYALRVSTAIFNTKEHLDLFETELKKVLSKI